MADETSESVGGPPKFPGEGGSPAAPAPPSPPSGPPQFPTGLRPYPDSAAGGYPPPSYEAGGGVPYASWGIRVGGYLIDAVIFLVVVAVLYIPFRHSHALALHMMMNRRGTNRRTISAAPFLISGILYIAYATILCGGRRGQTVGMMAVGLRVVRDGTLDTVGYGRAFGRALLEQILRSLELVVIAGGIIWLLDMLFPLWDSKRQTLHDKAFGTVVLRVQNTG